MEDNTRQNLNNQYYSQKDFDTNTTSNSTSGSSSAHSVDNQDKLKKLQQQLNTRNSDDDKKRKWRRLLWLLLLLLLIAIVGVGVYFFIKGSGELDIGRTIRLSVNVEEKLDGSTAEGLISTQTIFPGQKFPVVVEARNSNQFTGDSEYMDVAPIFVRFKIELLIEDKSYNNVIIPTLQTSNWCVYDEAVEQKPWDGYYYYNGRLSGQESIALFTQIAFDFHNTTNEMAGKNALIKVTVEAVEGEGKYIGGSEAWATAPDVWINFIHQTYGD